MPRGMNPNSQKALAEGRKKTMFTHETAVEAGKKGPKAKMTLRSFREELIEELSKEISDKNGNTSSVKNAIAKTVIQKALRGDMRALEFVRDTIGEKPVETVTVATIDAEAIVEIEKMVYDEE